MTVKNGFLTSEFWANFCVQLVGVLALLGYLSPDDADNWQKVSVQLGGLFAQCASAIYYAYIRKDVKNKASECECMNAPADEVFHVKQSADVPTQRGLTAGEIIAQKKAAMMKGGPAPVGSKMSVLALLLCFGLVTNCTYNAPLKTVDQMEPQQKAAFFMSVYNKEFENYKAQVARPDLTEGQRAVLREKKAVLAEVYPLIETYSDYVAAGVLPGKATEEAIIGLLDEIGGFIE
jgi:hypothetical protein